MYGWNRELVSNSAVCVARLCSFCFWCDSRCFECVVIVRGSMATPFPSFWLFFFNANILLKRKEKKNSNDDAVETVELTRD